MSDPAPGDVTHLLQQWRDGDPAALEQLTSLVYTTLHALARNQMRGERRGHVLQTTALVNEAFMRLVDVEVDFHDRAHFFAISARLMRQILVDFARERRSAKRGGEVPHLALEESLVPGSPMADVLGLDTALQSLERLDQRKAKIVEMRYFAGLTNDEIAGVLELSRATVEREVRFAKSWLSRELFPEPRPLGADEMM